MQPEKTDLNIIWNLRSIPFSRVLVYYNVKVPSYQSAKTYKVYCPFHPETNPSFAVYTESNSFYCFSCLSGGDSISFIREKEGCRFYPALEILSRIGGYKISADVLKEISQTFGGIWGSPDQVKKVYETRKKEEWRKLILVISEDFKQFYQAHPGWEAFYKTYIEWLWVEFEAITLMGDMTIEKLDALKDWLREGKRFIKKVAPGWKGLERLKREAWGERVGRI